MPSSHPPAQTTPAARSHSAPECSGRVGGNAGTDAGLLARMAQRDETAMAEFYDRHGAVLYSLALRILQESRAAEQAVQQAMATIWARASSYASTMGSVAGWATAITRSTAIAHRGPARPPAPAAEAAARPASATGCTDTPAARVRESLDHLHREQRAAIEMTFFDGLNQTELAARLGVPLNNARTLLRHAMMTMRDAAGGQL